MSYSGKCCSVLIYLRAIVSRAMQKNGMEEYSVSLLHAQHGFGNIIVASDPMVHLIHAVL